MSNITISNNSISLEERTKAHPCYSGGCQNARIHLPVAPLCNISCNYCNRKFDCVNESRPGVTSEVLKPEKALDRFLKVKEKVKNLKVVGIAGPGDALANFENTSRTLKLIREADSDITFCLSTNGLMLPYYAADLVKLGVTHITVTINNIDPDIGAQIYKEVSFLGTKYEGRKGAEILLQNQLAGIKLLVSLGVLVKINIVLIPGINDIHIIDVIKTVSDLGAFIGNVMPLIPAPGSVFQDKPLTSTVLLNQVRKNCEPYLKQMYHCKQCRADAIGELGNDISAEFRGCGSEKDSQQTEVHSEAVATICNPPNDYFTESDNNTYSTAIRIAVASRDGKLINEHFGHTKAFYIYDYKDEKVNFVEERQVDFYCKGAEDCGDEEERLERLISTISDSQIILVVRIGYRPEKFLLEKGILVFQTLGIIEREVLKAAKKYSVAEKSH